jgi:hypothetical protein
MKKPQKFYTNDAQLAPGSGCLIWHKRDKSVKGEFPVLVVPLTDEAINGMAHRMAEAFSGSYDGHLHITDLNAMLAAIGIKRRARK